MSTTFTPRHLSSMTVTLRTYDTATGTFKPVYGNISLLDDRF
jgi:hypothetical protein